MYPGRHPLILNGSVTGHEQLFNVHSCSIWQVPLYSMHRRGFHEEDCILKLNPGEISVN